MDTELQLGTKINEDKATGSVSTEEMESGGNPSPAKRPRPDDVTTADTGGNEGTSGELADRKESDGLHRPEEIGVLEASDCCTCPICDFVAKTPTALKIHSKRKHTGRGKSRIANTSEVQVKVDGPKAATLSSNVKTGKGTEENVNSSQRKKDAAGRRSQEGEAGNVKRGRTMPTKEKLAEKPESQSSDREMSSVITHETAEAPEEVPAKRELGQLGSKNKTMYACSDCGHEFRDKLSLDTHIKRRHTKEMNHFCELCSYACVAKYDYDKHCLSNKHKKRLAESTESSAHLPDADVTATRQSSNTMGPTRSSRRGLGSRFQLQCGSCEFRVSTAVLLESHTRLKHHGVHRFYCNVCQYYTATSEWMDAHVSSESHRQAAEAKNTGCSSEDCVEKVSVDSVCDDMLMDDVAVGVIGHDGELCFDVKDEAVEAAKAVLENMDEPPKDDKSPLKRRRGRPKGFTTTTCEHCGLVASNNTNLSVHIRRKHSRQYSYTCKLCSYNCVTKGDMDRHCLTKKHLKRVEDAASDGDVDPDTSVQVLGVESGLQVNKAQAVLQRCPADTVNKGEEGSTDQTGVLSQEDDKTQSGSPKMSKYDSVNSCSHCSFVAHSIPSLELHIKRRHTWDFEFVCLACSYYAVTRREMSRHAATDKHKQKCQVYLENFAEKDLVHPVEEAMEIGSSAGLDPVDQITRHTDNPSTLEHPNITDTPHPNDTDMQHPTITATTHPNIDDTEHLKVTDTEPPKTTVTTDSNVVDKEPPNITDTAHSNINTKYCNITNTKHLNITDTAHSNITDMEHPIVTDTEHPNITDTAHSNITNTEHPITNDRAHSIVIDSEHHEITDTEHLKITDTEHPNVTDTEHPNVTDTEHPNVTDTEHPNVTDTEHPNVNDTEHPNANDTEHPKVKDTEHPKVTDAEHLNISDTEHPIVTDTEHPIVTNTEHPKVTDTEHPKVTDTDHPNTIDVEHPGTNIKEHSNITGTEHPNITETEQTTDRDQITPMPSQMSEVSSNNNEAQTIEGTGTVYEKNSETSDQGKVATGPCQTRELQSGDKKLTEEAEPEPVSSDDDAEVVEKQLTRMVPFDACIVALKSQTEAQLALYEERMAHFADRDPDLAVSGPAGSPLKIKKNKPARASGPSRGVTPNPRIRCDDCGFVADGLSGLNVHISMKHPSKEKLFHCMLCGKSFYTESNLQQHLTSAAHQRNEQNSIEELPEGGATYKCVKCTDPFGTEQELFVHIKEKHEELLREVNKYVLEDTEQINREREENKGNICKHCGKVCKSSNSMAFLAHVRTHTGSKPFKCKICDFATAQLGDARNHVRRHLGMREYKCHICGWAFVMKKHLSTHLLGKHGLGQPKERKYECEVCERSFSEKWALNNHMKLHTGDKPYKCAWPTCHYAFLTLSAMKDHYRTHTGEKSFLCDLCGFAGGTRHALTKHRRQHTGERPFKCQLCSFASTTQSHLTRHKRVHTGRNPTGAPGATTDPTVQRTSVSTSSTQGSMRG
ncbi:hypothetical protein UPYG_G00145570 [Umbra pygmaea]|uniref:C2H2-type domain-containing protein n=1 Tax=Umbra pygmaea TaxID=75934 RepID=A0ABD0WW73_UMBPY